MHLTEQIRVPRSRDDVVELLCCDDALLQLLSRENTEIVERDGDHRTTETRYSALGREGVVTFRFTFRMDGSIRFEKVCDGKVWRKLEGMLSVEEIDDGRCVVELELVGSTRALVPEFSIKGPMEEQIRDMTAALREHLEK